MIRRLLTIVLVLAAALAGYTSTVAAQQLAIANGSHLRVVDTATNRLLVDVTRYSDVTRLAYRPDGSVLAVGECGRNRVVELDSRGNYAELGAPLAGAACPWDVTYAPDARSLAATMPVRPNPLGPLFGHLQIAGPQPLDVDLGRPLLAVAYRPGGGEIAVATPTGITILGPGPAYALVASVPGVIARALEYTTDGSTLIAGTGTGFVALDATQGYNTAVSDTNGAVLAVAVAQSGGWLALVRGNTVSVRRAMDLFEVASLTTAGGFRAADFSRDGALLAVAESMNTVRLYRAPAWLQVSTVTATGRIDAVAFRPQAIAQRLPVLFVHGAASGAGTTWFESGTGTSVAAALAANPQLPIDAFYIEMRLHDTPQAHGIEDDAADIQAMIEGGVDSRGRQQVGILNMPAYRKRGHVAIVAYSLGTITSRYYIKNLMGGGPPNGAITVSELVTLASPNHGITLYFNPLTWSAILCGVPDQQDRIMRQLCGGLTASSSTDSDPCGCTPMPFTSNVLDDATFLEDLNGHSLADSCRLQPSADSEAPRSRPTEPDGVLYVNLYASSNDDSFVGGHTDSDCVGRRLARNLAQDAINEEISGVPGFFGAAVHANFPHHWEVICMALRTVVDHQAPPVALACNGLTHP
jgi:hypothetical protein